MTRLSDNEQITLQLIIKPAKLREASSLSHKILGNENVLEHARGMQLNLFGKFARLLGELVSGLTELTREVHMGTAYGHRDYYNSTSKQKQSQDLSGDRPKRTLSVFELELMDTMHEKVTQPLFEVDLRVLVKSDEAKEHISAMKSALDGFSVPLYQSLRAKIRVPLLNRLRIELATERLPSLSRKGSMVLSASELASLYHFPSNRISKTDNLMASLSRTLTRTRISQAKQTVRHSAWSK